jgi:hypothetical protein
MACPHDLNGVDRFLDLAALGWLGADYSSLLIQFSSRWRTRVYAAHVRCAHGCVECLASLRSRLVVRPLAVWQRRIKSLLVLAQDLILARTHDLRCGSLPSIYWYSAHSFL